MILPRLDARLQQIADCVPTCQIAADIGTDHGKLTAWLLHNRRCQEMIASDISEISRAKARALFSRLGLLERVSIRSEDGLYALIKPVQAVIISGMGGGSIAQMLEQDVDLHGAELIMSAHTELPRLRETLKMRGYRICHEYVVRSGGRLYLVCHAKPGDMQLSHRERTLGVNLTATNTATPLEYLRWQMDVASTWQGEEANQFRIWIKETIENGETDTQNHL